MSKEFLSFVFEIYVGIVMFSKNGNLEKGI
jgi:hypothetical protein